MRTTLSLTVSRSICGWGDMCGGGIDSHAPHHAHLPAMHAPMPHMLPCHANPLPRMHEPCMPPCHACHPATHAPLPCTPPSIHAPATHAPCHAHPHTCPLACPHMHAMPPCHVCPLPCMPPATYAAPTVNRQTCVKTQPLQTLFVDGKTGDKSSGGSRIFLMGAPTRKVGGAILFFSRKLHKYERTPLGSTNAIRIFKVLKFNISLLKNHDKQWALHNNHRGPKLAKYYHSIAFKYSPWESILGLSSSWMTWGFHGNQDGCCAGIERPWRGRTWRTSWRTSLTSRRHFQGHPDRQIIQWHLTGKTCSSCVLNGHIAYEHVHENV